jgi:hypothetical protein
LKQFDGTMILKLILQISSQTKDLIFISENVKKYSRYGSNLAKRVRRKNSRLSSNDFNFSFLVRIKNHDTKCKT